MDILTSMKAPTPWHYKCKYCHEKLKASKYRITTTVFVGLLGLISGVVAAEIFIKTKQLLVPLLVVFIPILLSEFLLFFVYKKLGVKLEKRKTIST